MKKSTADESVGRKNDHGKVKPTEDPWLRNIALRYNLYGFTDGAFAGHVLSPRRRNRQFAANICEATLREFGTPLLITCQVLKHGAEKYSWENWRKVPNAVERYTEAALRHFYWERYYPDDVDGLDKESGLPHVAHAAACVAFLQELTR